MKKSLKSKGLAANIITAVVWLFIFLYSLTILALYIWVFLSTFKGKIEWNTNLFGFPKSFTFKNYINAFVNFQISMEINGNPTTIYIEELMLNSMLYVVGCSITATLAPALVAYATSKFDFKFNAVLDGIVIVTMILPIIGSEAAMIQMTQVLGLYDKMIGMYFMKFMFLGFNYLLFKSTFRGVDKAYSESAFLDGASEFRVMWNINFPMIGNVLAIVFTLQLMGFWADWTTPLMYMPHKPTVAFALYELQYTKVSMLQFEPLQFAACIMASLPTLVVFLIFRDKIMGGVAFGGLK